MIHFDTPRASSGALLAGAMLAWLVGVALQLQQAALWNDSAHAAFACCGGLALVACLVWPPGNEARAGEPRVGKPVLRAVVTWIASAALSFGVTGLHASCNLSDALPAALEKDDLVVVGVVDAMPQATESGVRLRLRVENALRSSMPGRAVEAVRIPSLLSLGWYRGMRDDDSTSPAPPPASLAAGQRWRFTVRLQRPHGNMNPHGFDYELWLFEQGLRATGHVRSNGEARPVMLTAASGHVIERARQHVRDSILRHVDDPRAAGVLAALAVGDQGAIGRADWDVFRDTGVAHLMSISGLHVTMFAWLAGGVIGYLWRRGRVPGLRVWLPRRETGLPLALVLPAPLMARWGGVTAAFGYALFSGWGVPAQRTVVMLAIVALLQTTSRRWPWPLVLATAACVVTGLDPWALLQAGFWLSFMAVGLLMASARVTPHGGTEPEVIASERGGTVASPRRPVQRAAAWLRAELSAGLRAQVIATVGLAPLTLVFFQQISVVGFVANLVAIPVVTLLVTPLALLGVSAPWLWSVGAVIVSGLSHALTWMAALPWAVWATPAAPWWAQCAALTSALLLLLPLPWKVRALTAPLVFPLLWPVIAVPPRGSFDVLAADVGQGTAVLVRTHSHLLVYDTGPQYSPDSDAGQRVLVPLLKALGERRVDKLVLSHRDTDHVGGAASLLSAMKVESMLSSLQAEHPLMHHERLQGRPNERCSAGQHWEWDGVSFDVLSPALADYDRKGGGANRLSCVVRVSSIEAASTSVDAEARSLLLAGDIEAEQEQRLVAGLGGKGAADSLRSDALIVPHHGSRTSSTAPFIAAVNARYAVVQAGYLNRFHHPAPDVVARHEASGATVHITPSCGAWLWQRDKPICQREVAPRYWHWKQGSS